MEKGNIAIIKK